MKYCKDCEHYASYTGVSAICTNKVIAIKRESMVYGITYDYPYCKDARINKKLCGSEAKYFKEKEVGVFKIV